MAEIDREKVIKGITHHKLCQCEICPYWEEEADCMKKMLGDALTLLKEQEQAMKEKDGTISNLIVQIKEISQCYERVVRCKDCKHGKQLFQDYVSCKISEENESGCHASHKPDWFCADGERKEGR